MSDKLEKLKKIRATVRKYEDTLAYYKKIFLADGFIDDYEQTQINKLEHGIQAINAKLAENMKALSGSEMVQDIQNATTEFAADAMSREDDIVDHTLIDNIPLSKVLNSKIDGLKITVHSAFWTEKLLDMIMNDHTIGAEQIVEEIIRINKKQYKDESSRQHAIKNYECRGNLVSVTKGSGDFELTGYTNAKDGGIQFTIYMVARGTVEVKIIEGIPDKKGMQHMGGVPGAAATFVMKYSGFGKLGRALHNYMDGKDPWTGEKGSTWRLTVGGITDLLTMGVGGGSVKVLRTLKDVVKIPAVTNILLNIVQEAIENASPERLKAIGLSREALDMALSLTGDNKYINAMELVTNLVQAGLVGEDDIRRWLGKDLKEEDLIKN